MRDLLICCGVGFVLKGGGCRQLPGLSLVGYGARKSQSCPDPAASGLQLKRLVSKTSVEYPKATVRFKWGIWLIPVLWPVQVSTAPFVADEKFSSCLLAVTSRSKLHTRKFLLEGYQSSSVLD